MKFRPADRLNQTRRIPALLIAASVFAVTWAMPHPAPGQTDSEEALPEPFLMGNPINCPDGETCWIVNYPDKDRSRKSADYNCGRLSTNRQYSTDFAVNGNAAVRKGIPVQSVAPGVVLGARNNGPDYFRGKPAKPIAKNRYCGNGVLIEHDEGWTTQYCHLRKGSVTVRKGDEVAEGQMIGFVGLSGDTIFPHLSLTLRRDKTVVDPFVGPAPTSACGLGEGQVWRSPDDPGLAYLTASILGGGFVDIRPNKTGPAPKGDETLTVSRQISKVYLWADLLGIRPNDQIIFEIFGPEGKRVMDHTTTLKNHQYRKRASVEFLKRGQFWSGGMYRGTVTLRRHFGGTFEDHTIERHFDMR
jgi:hypothetical protein